MNWNTAIGFACLLAFIFPAAVIIYNRFYTHRSLAALLIYFVIKIIFVMMLTGVIPASKPFRSSYYLFNSYLDVPLMMTTLLFFCPIKQKQRIIHLLNISFISYEIIISCIYGLNSNTVVYIQGPGLALILGYTFYLFVRQVKFTIMHGKNMGRLLMLASTLFAYACYLLIYYFYYIQKTPDRQDTVLLYYISSFVAATLMGIGLHLMRRRMKELRSLKITRKELALFFNN